MSEVQRIQLPTNIILVYGSLRTGGIETLIVRIANYLALSGVRVTVCCTTGGRLESSLEERVNVIAYSETRHLVRAINAEHIQWRNSGAILIISFDPISAARALMIELSLPKTPRVTHISGVFHPRAYFMTGERKDRVFLNYLLSLAVDKQRLFFMNEECRKTHSIKWGRDISSCPLLALPVNSVAQAWKPLKGGTIRVVSVGRLVDFKTYNMGSSGIVRACLDRGVNVTWDIYGDGPQYSAIKAEINALNLTASVRLMGELDYEKFSSKVAEYDLFVGMGTSALEAAMVGVPTICATVDEALHCYGYLYELPFGNVGELQITRPSVEIARLIQDYAASDRDYRVQISRECQEAAEKYGMPKFIESIARMAANTNTSPSKYLKRGIAELYCFATESWLAKGVRRFISKNASVS